MKRMFLLLVVPALLVVGCKNREAQLAGTWTGGGQTIDVKADKTWSAKAGPMALNGTWTFADPKVTLNVDKSSLDGIKQTVKQQLKANPALLALGGGEKKVMDQLDQLEKPQTATLSEDGKTLTVTNSAAGQGLALTKQESK